MEPGCQPDPAESKSQEGQTKTNRAPSRQVQEPSVGAMTLTPQGARACQFEHAGAQCHHHDQERDGTKADAEVDEAVANQPERAKRKSIQRQEPDLAPPRPPETSGNRTNPCRHGKLTQKRNRAIPRVECQGSIRALHDQVDCRYQRFKNAAQCQQPPVSFQRFDQGAPPGSESSTTPQAAGAAHS